MPVSLIFRATCYFHRAGEHQEALQESAGRYCTERLPLTPETGRTAHQACR